MFHKVLIAEDHESSNVSVRKTLEDAGVSICDYTYYCDDAFQRARKALLANEPYELLITDLSFEEDYREQKLKNGADLITEIRKIQPHIKVLVFSAESKVSIIDQLFRDLDIDAYVRKARRDVEELKKALEALSKGNKYMPFALKQAVKTQSTYEFSEYDIILLTQLSHGMLQKDIPYYLEKNGYKPSGLSSVEKRLNLMRETLGCSKNEQLIAFCKDLGII
jgi:DNA-binding NarL/FixJ family response regulator